jgi:hypothetical protein
MIKKLFRNLMEILPVPKLILDKINIPAIEDPCINDDISQS